MNLKRVLARMVDRFLSASVSMFFCIYRKNDGAEQRRREGHNSLDYFVYLYNKIDIISIQLNINWANATCYTHIPLICVRKV